MTTKKTTTAKKTTTKAAAEKKTTTKKTTTKKATSTKAAVAVAEPAVEVVAPTVKEKLVATMMPETPTAEVSMEAVVAKAEPEVAPAPVAEKKTIVLTIGMFQKRLSELGFYNGPWDGVYGPMTKHAAARFQAANGLAVNGDANPATLAALGLDLYKTY